MAQELTVAALSLLALHVAGCGAAPDSASDVDAREDPIGDGASVLYLDRTERPHALEYGIPVSGTAHKANAKRTVVYSVELGDVGTDPLLLRGLVLVSRCDRGDLQAGSGLGQGHLGSPCGNFDYKSGPRPYGDTASTWGYDPNVAAAIVLGDSDTDVNGPLLSDWATTVGDASQPDFQKCTHERHRCPMAIDATVSSGTDRSGKYVNLVAVAWSPGAKAADIVELQGDCADYSSCVAPAYEDPKSPDRDAQGGQLAVIDLGGGSSAKTPANAHLLSDRVGVQVANFNPGAKLVASTKITGLSQGDIVDATASLELVNDPANNAITYTHAGQSGTYEFKHLAAGLLLLTSDPDAVRITQGSSPFDVYVTPRGGTNCDAECIAFRRTGAALVSGPPDVTPPTMYLNLVAFATNQVGVKTSAEPHAKVASASLAVRCRYGSTAASQAQACEATARTK